MEPDWEIQRFDHSHDRSRFDCGVTQLNDWLRKQVSQYQKRDLSRTYVAVQHRSSLVHGYYALSMHRVSHEVLPSDLAKGLSRLDVPVVLLGQFAVDKSVQGQGLGALLLLDALARSAHVSHQVGVRAVEVDAIGEAARSFYTKYGFTALRDDPRHLYLPMHVIRKLNLPAPELG